MPGKDMQKVWNCMIGMGKQSNHSYMVLPFTLTISLILDVAFPYCIPVIGQIGLQKTHLLGVAKIGNRSGIYWFERSVSLIQSGNIHALTSKLSCYLSESSYVISFSIILLNKIYIMN